MSAHKTGLKFFLGLTSCLTITTLSQAQVFEDEIIVTAQKKAESLQDVGVSVSAFSGEQMEALGWDNSLDVSAQTPGLITTSNTGDAGNIALFSIRGVSQLDFAEGQEAPIAIYRDQAYVSSPGASGAPTFDMERIEVLRGPQGTLFGRNATSGVVNIVTAKPKPGVFEASLDGEYGNFDAYKVKGMVNVPLGDTFAARVAGIYVKRDGYTRNTFTGNNIDGRDIYSIRGSLRWEPGPDTTIDLLASYFREDDDRLRIQKQQCQEDPTGVLGCLNNRRDFGKTNPI